MLSISKEEIAWVAGFLEGEGSFLKVGKSISVTATQVQRQPLERLVNLLGGNINTFSRKEVVGSVYHRWVVYGSKAVEVMLAVYSWMSPRRKGQIEKAFSVWVKQPGSNNRGGYSLEAWNGLRTNISSLLISN